MWQFLRRRAGESKMNYRSMIFSESRFPLFGVMLFTEA
jgi:hypothetical protein